MELLGDAERAVAPHADQACESQLPNGHRHLFEQGWVDPHSFPFAHQRGEPAPVGGPQDRAALQENARGVLGVERHVVDGLDETLIAAQKPNAVVAQSDGRLRRGPDDGVEAWTVAATGEDADRGPAAHKSLTMLGEPAFGVEC